MEMQEAYARADIERLQERLARALREVERLSALLDTNQRTVVELSAENERLRAIAFDAEEDARLLKRGNAALRAALEEIRNLPLNCERRTVDIARRALEAK